MNSATGKISRMYVDENTCFLQLEYNQHTIDEGTPKPHNGYFKLLKTHKNYNSLYALFLAASVNRYDVWLRNQNDIVSNQEAVIVYAVIDW